MSHEEGAIVGICSPTHGFNLPPITLSFLTHLPASKRNAAFIVNTRAGMKISRMFTPGLSGVAQILGALILRIKGYRIIGMKPIDLPSNWISLHPGIRGKVVASIYGRCKEKTVTFARKILSGKRDFSALYDLVQDILIAPVALGYYLFGRFFLAKSFIATRECDQCGLCIKSCPVKAIRETSSRPFWTYNCESCMKCMNHCPKRAIQTAHGFIILLSFGFAKLFSIFYIFLTESGFHFIDVKIIRQFSSLIIFLIFLFLGYRVLHLLMRFSMFERLIAYTSFTKYNFWRRYKAPRKA